MTSVAIIGAGASGLVAIKCCLEEGLTPTCFERMHYIGGLWHYTDDIEDNQACVMKSTVTNTSKEMMCFSDFPMPDHYPMYMFSNRVENYFHLYAEHFKLKDHIQLQMEVLDISKTEEFYQTGRWNVKIKNKKTDLIVNHVFDAVMVCTGHHAQKHVPNLSGLSEFQGRVLHTHDYKRPVEFTGKRILVVGIGNSGGDVAVELSHFASQVYVATRRGRWILPRLVKKGHPLDMSGSTRFNMYLWDKFPRLVQPLTVKEINRRFDHDLYSLRPQHHLVPHQITLNDFLHIQIACGAIIVKPNIQTFTRHGVEFDDGTYEDNIDVIVFATGYTYDFPFIDKSLLEVKNNRVDLYKMVFPPDLEHPTLCVIGCVQAPGAVIPLSEMQARLATRVIQKKIKLPSKDEMLKEIQERHQTILKNHVQSEINSIQVHYIKYMDELAEIHGSKPKFGELLISDPRLAVKCIFGPCTPYQYRLSGPGAWPGAREAIYRQWERTFCSLKTRKTQNKNQQNNIKMYSVYCLMLVVVILISLFIK